MDFTRTRLLHTHTRDASRVARGTHLSRYLPWVLSRKQVGPKQIFAMGSKQIFVMGPKQKASGS